jgi:TolB-like protein/lipoprotein NlpI
MAELFISYSKANREQALALADELRGRGFSVWIDQGGIRGAKQWSAEIVEAIDACSTLLLLISPDSIASRNVAKEVHLASEKGRNILPVVIEKVALPSNFEYPLAGIQRVYYHDRPAIFRALEMLNGVEATEQLLPSRAEEDSTIRLAVMPFDDLSPQHDNQWFADGMMDELISTLGTIDKMKIPSRSDVLHYRDHSKKSHEIASELGVRYLIEGSVRKGGEKIRINASLTDTLRGEQLWTNKFDGSFDDVFAFQEEVSMNITEVLKLKLTREELHKVEDHGTHNAEAYELFLKGRHEQYYVTKESYLRALDLYEQAAALDTQFERAHIGVASICCVYYREYSKNPKWLKRAEESLAKAEAIKGETSKTLYIRGMIEWLKGNNEVAIATLTRSTELDPQNHNTFNILGAIYTTKGDYSAAVEVLQHVAERSESTTDYFNLLIALGGSDKIDRRSEVAQKALPIFDRYMLREPEDSNAALLYCYVLLWAGRKEVAAEAAARLYERSDLSGHAIYNLGFLYSQLGKPKLYISLVRKAIASGYREIEQTRNATFLPEESVYEEEFKAILKELEELIEREKNSLE